MEDVLNVYHRPHDPTRPQVCMDECSQQLIGEVRAPLPPRPGDVAKYDCEYERHGTANLFLAIEPLAGQRVVQVTDQRTRHDWAQFIRYLLLTVYPDAAALVLVMDGKSTVCQNAALCKKARCPSLWHCTPVTAKSTGRARASTSVVVFDQRGGSPLQAFVQACNGR